MSRGRTRHQTSRRRMYSARQRDLRERRLHASRWNEHSPDEAMVSFEIEEATDSGEVTVRGMSVRRGATAA